MWRRRWQIAPDETPPKRHALSPAQIEIVGQFSDFTFYNPNLTFETGRQEKARPAFISKHSKRKKMSSRV